MLEDQVYEAGKSGREENLCLVNWLNEKAVALPSPLLDRCVHFAQTSLRQTQLLEL
jgi:hypothetical protein